MAPRDPRPAARINVARKRATSDKANEAAKKAHKAYRDAVRKAVEVGVTKADLARDLGTSEARVRQLTKRSIAESER